LAESARRNRVELVDAKLSRRDLFKMGLLTSGGFLVAKAGLSSRAAEAGAPVSPRTRPWIEEITNLPVAQPCTAAQLDCMPTETCQSSGKERARTRHEHWDRIQVDDLDCYANVNAPVQHSWHRDLPTDDCWAFNGQFPGPRIHARAGKPVLIRWRNELMSVAAHRGYGLPTPTTHLHNGHTASESDGNPLDTFASGEWHDSLYLNRNAGFTDPRFGPMGDPRETLSTMWYHDHCLDFTAQNVYRGNMGLYFQFTEFDSGNENDPNPVAWRLPSGDFDVPLVLHDRVFAPNGKGYFDLFNLDGVIGDKMTVNGKVEPFMRVARRKYRFRILNMGPSRFYNLFLSNSMNMVQLSHDGNFLPMPLTVRNIRFTVASRVDVIIDFTNQPSGREIFLVNCQEQKDGRGPTGKLLPLALGTKVLKFVVDGTIDTKGDPSRIPTRLLDLPPIPRAEVVTERTFIFDRKNGGWSVNGKPFDHNVITAEPRLGTAEIWNFVNNSGGWMHPIHVHFEEHQILTRNGKTPPRDEIAREDVVWLGHGETVKTFRRFRDFTGRYVTHCHNVVHEDHGMMFQWKIKP
jgi:FtsP/CotA-like multicopper oxidase with cupredoxin domain